MTDVAIENLLEDKLPSLFPDWFSDYVREPFNEVTCPYLKSLAEGPFKRVSVFESYVVNGLRFHTMESDTNKSTINCGVCVKGADQKGSDDDLFDFYGKLKRIVRLEYAGVPLKRTVLFEVDWYDPGPNGTRVDEQRQLVEINHKRRYKAKYEPFILAVQARQVMFVEYPSLKRDKADWLAAIHVQARSRVEYVHMDKSNTNSYQEEVVDETARNPVKPLNENIDLHENIFVDLTINDEDPSMFVLYIICLFILLCTYLPIPVLILL